MRFRCGVIRATGAQWKTEASEVKKELSWELLEKVSDQRVRKLSPGDVEADDPIIPNVFKLYGLHI